MTALRGVRAFPSLWIALAVATTVGCGRPDDRGSAPGAPTGSAPPDPAATTLPEPAPTDTPAPAADTRRPSPQGASPPPPSDAPRPPDRAGLTGRTGRRAAASASASSAPIAHPLADWMRGPVVAAWDSRDLESIARTFDQMARWAPPGYANWASIARDGAEATRAGSLEATKAACRGCHAEYEARYKAERSTLPLP